MQTISNFCCVELISLIIISFQIKKSFLLHKKAQATLVNYHHKLFLSAFWGDGSTSSSDGMRVQVGVSSLHADANPHYGTGKGTTMYRFVSDQFSTFYTKVINTNARDAVHVIDGLLYHETDLNIEEHYTDTAGYTDQVFGLSHLLGFKFASRIRDISELKLYCIGKGTDYPKIESILNGRINIKIIEDNFDDVLRLAHSIREGKVTGSLIMGKLGSYARQNALATGLMKYAIIQMIKRGINQSVIIEFTGNQDDIYKDCQNDVNEEKFESRNRYLDSKLRGIDSFDIL